MDAFRDHHTKLSKWERERQIPYISLICGIKNMSQKNNYETHYLCLQPMCMHNW